MEGTRQRRGDGSHVGGSAATPSAAAAPAARVSWKERAIIYRLTGDVNFDVALTWAALMILVTLGAELTSSTAYGKFAEKAVVTVPARLGWWLLELPVTITFLFFFAKGGSQSRKLVPRLMAGVMCWHYCYRGWIFPYLMNPHKESKFDIVPALFGSLVTITHGYLNAKWFAEHGKHLTNKWLRDPRFWVGLLLYASGFCLVVYHDHILRNLRQPGGPRYVVPHGGFFEYVTCAQYFAELWMFLGFAILSWGPNGAYIFLVSVCNLVPRAVETTRWYREKFGDEYPQDRGHIIPFIF